MAGGKRPSIARFAVCVANLVAASLVWAQPSPPKPEPLGYLAIVAVDGSDLLGRPTVRFSPVGQPEAKTELGGVRPAQFVLVAVAPGHYEVTMLDGERSVSARVHVYDGLATVLEATPSTLFSPTILAGPSDEDDAEDWPDVLASEAAGRGLGAGAVHRGSMAGAVWHAGHADDHVLLTLGLGLGLWAEGQLPNALSAPVEACLDLAAGLYLAPETVVLARGGVCTSFLAGGGEMGAGVHLRQVIESPLYFQVGVHARTWGRSRGLSDILEDTLEGIGCASTRADCGADEDAWIGYETRELGLALEAGGLWGGGTFVRESALGVFLPLASWSSVIETQRDRRAASGAEMPRVLTVYLRSAFGASF